MSRTIIYMGNNWADQIPPSQGLMGLSGYYMLALKEAGLDVRISPKDMGEALTLINQTPNPLVIIDPEFEPEYSKGIAPPERLERSSIIPQVVSRIRKMRKDIPIIAEAGKRSGDTCIQNGATLTFDSLKDTTPENICSLVRPYLD